MIRINRLTDYGIVLLTHIASRPKESSFTAKSLAAETHLPVPVVSKILKLLTREGLLVSQRGSKGGYHLARKPEQITVAQVIRGLEGPIAITECTVDSVTGSIGPCGNSSNCAVHGNWQRINQVVEEALEEITLLEMIKTPQGCLTKTEFEKAAREIEFS